MNFQIEEIKNLNFHRLEELYERSGSINLFYHPLVFKAVENLEPENQPTHFVFREQERKLTAFMPLSLKQNRFRIFAPDSADHVEPLYIGEREPTLNAMFDFLIQELNPTFFWGKNLSNDFSNFIEKKYIKHHPEKVQAFRSPVLMLPETEDAFFEKYSANTRSQLRRKIRKAEKDNISFRYVYYGNLPENHSFEEAFLHLTRLHSMRFDSIDKSSRFLREVPQIFHGSLCRLADEKKSNVLFTEALLDGNVIGSFYGLLSPHRYEYIMSGFDPAFEKNSIGRLLIYYAIKFCIDNKIPVFDFLRGTESYKWGWTEDFIIDYNMYVPLKPEGKLIMMEMFLKDQVKRKGRLKGSIDFLKENIIRKK